MAQKEGEWERLIPIHTPEFAVSPETPNTRPQTSYPLFPETEILLTYPQTQSSGSSSSKCSENSTVHTSITLPTNGDAACTFRCSNPHINLNFPSPEHLYDLEPVTLENGNQNELETANEFQQKVYLREENLRPNPESSYYQLLREHDQIDRDQLESQPDDTKSQSRLSASPDFWRRVSPQLVYIDSGSYGGSCRSGSLNSGSCYSRDRSCEREPLDGQYPSTSNKGFALETGKELDRRSVESEGNLDSARSVSWNLAQEKENVSDRKTKQRQWLEGRPLVGRQGETIDGDHICGDSETTNITLEDQRKDVESLHQVDQLNDNFFSKLKRKWAEATGGLSMREDKTERNQNDGEIVCTPDENVNRTVDSPVKFSVINRAEKEVKHHSVVYSNSQSIISTSSTNEPLEEKLKVKEKEAYGDTNNTSNHHSNYIDTSKNKEADSNACPSTVISSETKTERGKLRRYFSLDSSPVPVRRNESIQKPRLLPLEGRFGKRVPLRRQQALVRPCQLHHPQREDSQHRGGHRDSHGQPNMQYYMEKDLRYYFQHPWFRLFVAYLVIFCNFLLFAEDPLSHSHTESNINIVGNVFSFVATKYPTEWYWKFIKVVMWVLAVLCGMLVGKVLIHGLLFKRMIRLKMFRDEQGSWMCMFLTVIVSVYMFSYVYNLLLLIGHDNHMRWQITSAMGVTNESMMKAAATCTWLGDLVTALMVTDMMLQDRLYPHWGTRFRRLYTLSDIPRILIFWVGSIVVSAVVIFLIVSDYISWNNLNEGFVETTELSRAFLASFILVMDLLIVMQDWDFPHFTSTIDVNLPGFSTHTLHWKWAKLSFTGKWFNYGIIFMVMILDLNMWKNQLFYTPEEYGQYIDPVSRKVYMVEDSVLLASGNMSLWTWQYRSQVHPETGRMLRDDDSFMYSRWMGYSTGVKCTAFIPNLLGMILFFTLVTLYGRFPPNQDGTYGGRLKKRQRSSWRRERHSISEHYCPEAVYGEDQYMEYPHPRGSACTCAGSRYMQRCTTSQPTIADTHYSDPGVSSPDRNRDPTKEFFDEAAEQASDLQYNMTQHSDPGLIDSRPSRSRHKSSEFRDIRVFDDSLCSADLDEANDQVLQQHFTEILEENEKNLCQEENWSHQTANCSDSEQGSIHLENYRERFTRAWRETYARKFKWTMSRRPGDEHCEQDSSCVSGRDKFSVESTQQTQLPSSSVSNDPDYTELCKSATANRRKIKVQKQHNFSKGHKRLSSNSSAETNLVEPTRLRIDGIRFFRRKKRTVSSSAENEGGPQDEEVQEGAGDEECPPSGDGVATPGPSPCDRQDDERVEIYTRARPRCDDEDSGASEGSLRQINFGSNPSVNL